MEIERARLEWFRVDGARLSWGGCGDAVEVGRRRDIVLESGHVAMIPRRVIGRYDFSGFRMPLEGRVRANVDFHLP